MMAITGEITATRTSGVARLVNGVRRRITSATGFLVSKINAARRTTRRVFGRRSNRIYPVTSPVLPQQNTLTAGRQKSFDDWSLGSLSSSDTESLVSVTDISIDDFSLLSIFDLPPLGSAKENDDATSTSSSDWWSSDEELDEDRPKRLSLWMYTPVSAADHESYYDSTESSEESSYYETSEESDTEDELEQCTR